MPRVRGAGAPGRFDLEKQYDKACSLVAALREALALVYTPCELEEAGRAYCVGHGGITHLPCEWEGAAKALADTEAVAREHNKKEQLKGACSALTFAEKWDGLAEGWAEGMRLTWEREAGGIKKETSHD